MRTIEMHRGGACVAQIVEFDDLTCAMRWLGDTPGTALYAHIKTLAKVHGHEGTEFFDVGRAFSRGEMNAIQDRCENCPYASVGGHSMTEPEKWEAPPYIVERERIDYLRGYLYVAMGDEWNPKHGRSEALSRAVTEAGLREGER